MQGPGALLATSPSTRTDSAGPPAGGVDLVTVLSWYVVLLLALPSRLTVGPLGGAGSPAALVGLGIGAWWVLDLLRRSETAPPSGHPVRRACLVAVACVGFSYVVAMSRAIAPGELSTADLGLVALASWTAVLVAAEDGITVQSRLDRLLRVMVMMAAAVAVLGLLQFLTGQQWVDRISVPGLVTNQSLGDLGSRGSFNRPSGTALHPIEFGAVLTMMLPIAINLALTDAVRGAVRRWFPVAAISLAILLSISRSALICAVVAMVVVGARWAPQVRRAAAVATTGLLLVVFMTIPGMVGTLLGMFTSAGSDTSTLSRVDSYSTAGRFIEVSPLFGRGFGTFLPSYRILDNQYLLLLIEVGVAGTAAFLFLMAVGVVSALRARRLTTDFVAQQRAQSLAAAVAAGAVGLAFYDGFSFPMATGTLFLLLGVTGAQLRLARGGSRS